MHVGVMRLVLEIPGARSLKDKRQVVRSFKERVKSRLGVSIAEVGHHDKLQRGDLRRRGRLGRRGGVRGAARSGHRRWPARCPTRFSPTARARSSRSARGARVWWAASST